MVPKEAREPAQGNRQKTGSEVDEVNVRGTVSFSFHCAKRDWGEIRKEDKSFKKRKLNSQGLPGILLGTLEGLCKYQRSVFSFVS